MWLQSRPKSHDIYEAGDWLKKCTPMSKDGILQISEAFVLHSSDTLGILDNDICDVTNSLQHRSMRTQHNSIPCCTQVPWKNQNGR